MLARIFFGKTFPGFGGDWEYFEGILKVGFDRLRGKLGQGGVTEETHHVGLACDLIEACLQQRPEDR